MTGTHTQNPVYSRLTLALLEDSGWYKANYSLVFFIFFCLNCKIFLFLESRSNYTGEKVLAVILQ